jgi:hypothetical protein
MTVHLLMETHYRWQNVQNYNIYKGLENSSKRWAHEVSCMSIARGVCGLPRDGGAGSDVLVVG